MHEANDVEVAHGIVSTTVVLVTLTNLNCLKLLSFMQCVRSSISMIFSNIKSAEPLFGSMTAVGLFLITPWLF